MSKSREFSSNTINNLGYYVYIYSDPDTKVPFYIGKGKGNRCFNHLFLENDSEKVAKIQEILKKGKDPIIEFWFMVLMRKLRLKSKLQQLI